MVLIINLVEPLPSITGTVTYELDPSEPACSFDNNGEINELPNGLCCHELQKQITCDPIDSSEFDFECYTSKESGRKYLVNNKLINYCKQEGYTIETK